MVDNIFWWLGLFTALIGSIGALSLLLIGSLNTLFRLTGFGKVLLTLYREHLERKHSSDRMPA